MLYYTQLRRLRKGPAGFRGLLFLQELSIMTIYCSSLRPFAPPPLRRAGQSVRETGGESPGGPGYEPGCSSGAANDPKSFTETAAARRHEKLAFSFSQWYDAKTWMSGIGVSGGTPAPGVGSMQPVCMLASEKAQGLQLPLEKVENEVKIIWGRRMGQ